MKLLPLGWSEDEESGSSPETTTGVAPRVRSRFPALPPGWLARGRLHRQLALGTERAVTLVTGPPGSGKTVLLSGWAQRAVAGPVAWVSLDHADNDPSWFWAHLADAVGAVDAHLAVLVGRARTPSSDRTPEEASPSVAVGAPTTTRPVVVVVDDLQMLSTPEAIEAAGSLVRHLPPGVRLILAGRHVPSVSREALQAIETRRAAEQLFEIGPADLRFTTEEVIDFFASPHTSPLPVEAVTALANRTDGWAAGLRLADLMVPEFDSPGTFLDGVTGDARLVAEYFRREVIDGLTAESVGFLLATSVFDELTIEGCAAVTRRPDAGALLEALGDQLGLLARSATTGRSYRYHPLFHEFLRHRLHQDAPALSRQCHLRAAAWCEASGDDQAAVRHLIQAGAYQEALALGGPGVARTLDDRFLPGDTALAITGLPEHYVARDPLRLYLVAAAYLGELRLTAAASSLRALERVSRDHPQRTLLQGRGELLWTLRDGLLADPEGVLRQSVRAVTLLESYRRGIGRRSNSGPSDPSGPADPFGPAPGTESSRSGAAQPPWLDDLDDVLVRRLPAAAAAAHLWLDHPDAARTDLADLTDVADLSAGAARSDDPDRLAILAGVACWQGQLDDASRLAGRALDRARQHNRTGGISILDGLLTMATVSYERDDLPAAMERLEEAQRLCMATRLSHWRAAVGCDQAQNLIALGHPSDALERILDLRQDEVDDPRPEHLRRRLDHVEVRARLALGDLDGAVRVVQSLADEAPAISTQARLDLAAGRPDRAVERLAAHRGMRPRPRVEIERLLLLARGYLQLGDDPRAQVALRRAIDLGRPGRFIRLFVDEGPELSGTLLATPAAPSDVYLAELLSRIAGVRLRATTAVEVLEPLTDRERELLGYLPSHLSQHEIAALMYISLNTVKTHTKAVYRKLGASSRSEAVDQARAHGLIQ